MRRKSSGWVWAIVAAMILLVVIGALWVGNSLSVSYSESVSPPSQTSSMNPSPTSSQFPANTVTYSLYGLPEINVFAIEPRLPTDVAFDSAFTGEAVRAIADRIPVFANVNAEPVAYLPREYLFGGTIVPIIERHVNWIKVLLPGRAAIPSAGDPGQLTGWVRSQDVEISPLLSRIEVDLGAHTIDIVGFDGKREQVTDAFGWGALDTPTPVGRTFVMLVRSEPSIAYTRNHPLIYLGIQSPTLDGFDGAPVAVTAFHYHDDSLGPVSNGCLRLTADAVKRLAQLPAGTPVTIR